MNNKLTSFGSRHLATIVAVGVCAIWGETFVSSKVLLSAGLMPADIFFFRFSLAYLCMSVFSHRRRWAKSWKHELLLVATGVLGGSLYFLSENMALLYSTASNVAILVGSTPLVTALLLALFYKDERMHGRQIVGSLIAFLGMALVILNGQLVLHLNPRGDLLALGASLTWGFYSLIMKKLSPLYDALFITRKVFAYGVLSIIPYFIFVQPLQLQTEILLQPKVWGNLLYLALIASMLCYFGWNWALSKLGTVRTTNIVYLQPFFTMIISYIVLHERITWMAIAGSVVLILGMVLAVKTARRSLNECFKLFLILFLAHKQVLP